jgi:hypothetical protein
MGITSQHIDSISSCNSSSYAEHLLEKCNPQDCDEPKSIHPKQARYLPMSYTAIALDHTDFPIQEHKQDPVAAPITSISTLTDDNVTSLFNKMKHLFDTPTEDIYIDLEAR